MSATHRQPKTTECSLIIGSPPPARTCTHPQPPLNTKTCGHLNIQATASPCKHAAKKHNNAKKHRNMKIRQHCIKARDRESDATHTTNANTQRKTKQKHPRTIIATQPRSSPNLSETTRDHLSERFAMSQSAMSSAVIVAYARIAHN